tara:strand:+ start:1134 stop:1427 length:294 start_codon:yes stop_codon:yes gene_type:complete
MSTIDPQIVSRIAHLARLRFSPEELTNYGSELAKVLDHVAVLDRLSESTEPPVDHRAGTPERSDQATNENSPETILSNAPDTKDSFFRVPAVISEEA